MSKEMQKHVPQARWENRPDPDAEPERRGPGTKTIIVIAIVVGVLIAAARHAGEDAIALVQPTYAAGADSASRPMAGDGTVGYFPSAFLEPTSDARAQSPTF